MRALAPLLVAAAGCAASPAAEAPAPPATSPAAAPSPSGPAVTCAIVPWSCTCSWACRTPNEGTCANACPNLDDPSTREPPPKRPCGPKNGACAFLD